LLLKKARPGQNIVCFDVDLPSFSSLEGGRNEKTYKNEYLVHNDIDVSGNSFPNEYFRGEPSGKYHRKDVNTGQSPTIDYARF